MDSRGNEQKKMSHAVLVGANQAQEWLLPWWWENYSRHNFLPVLFADFGMSAKMRAWCQKRGLLLPIISDSILFPSIEHTLKPGLQLSRKAWFQKPLACHQAPVEHAIWIDLDCEVRGSLFPLFGYLTHPDNLVLVTELDLPPPPIYNSGVVVFRPKSPVIADWAKQTLIAPCQVIGDQELLSEILSTQPERVDEMPTCYNRLRDWPDTQGTVIRHWYGPKGKEWIREAMGKKI
jgi:hypothetical protein